MASYDVQLGRVLIDFSTNGTFPEEEEVSAAHAESFMFPAVLKALSAAKSDLETEIREISRESASDVDDWIVHAKAILEDIKSSRKLANRIVQQAEEDEERLEGLKEKEAYADFLTKEVSFSQSLLLDLIAIQNMYAQLVEAERLVNKREFADGVSTLAAALESYSAVPLDKTARAMRLLGSKCTEVRNFINEQLLSAWNALVMVDTDAQTITIREGVYGENTELDQVVIGLKSYSQIDKVARKFCNDLEKLIIEPRITLDNPALRAIEVKDNTLIFGPMVDHSVKPLFVELENVIRFLVGSLPSDVVVPLSEAIMPTLSDRIVQGWLDRAVPSSLNDMTDYQMAIARVSEFVAILDSLNWPGTEGLNEWVENSSKIWLNKRRETALDWIRNKISLGVGTPVLTERVEKRMFQRHEYNHTAAMVSKNSHDWNAAWDSDEDCRSQGISDESKRQASMMKHVPLSFNDWNDAEDDAAESWGWGDDDATEDQSEAQGFKTTHNIESTATTSSINRVLNPELREVTLSEKYWTSSMPRSVLKMVIEIYEDAAVLSQTDYQQVPVAPAAPGLCGVPIQVLAMYRAISPNYYALDLAGNMYRYNDAIWLSESLREFLNNWKKRTDLTPRVHGMVRLDSEVTVLESFGKRAYTNELNAQRMIIFDLLAGTQNFFQHMGTILGELEDSVQIVIAHVRDKAALWEKILPYSAWASATGSMVNAVATKLINDVFDHSDIGVDEAERIAIILSKVESLDDLFIRKSDKDSKNCAGEFDVPMTAQFADNWMKMKFLSEVLQSNLKDMKFLWFQSDLSLYYTVDEVVELIALSFQMNAGVRQVIKEIKDNPTPKK